MTSIVSRTAHVALLRAAVPRITASRSPVFEAVSPPLLPYSPLSSFFAFYFCSWPLRVALMHPLQPADKWAAACVPGVPSREERLHGRAGPHLSSGWGRSRVFVSGVGRRWRAGDMDLPCSPPSRARLAMSGSHPPRPFQRLLRTLLHSSPAARLSLSVWAQSCRVTAKERVMTAPHPAHCHPTIAPPRQPPTRHHRHRRRAVSPSQPREREPRASAAVQPASAATRAFPPCLPRPGTPPST